MPFKAMRPAKIPIIDNPKIEIIKSSGDLNSKTITPWDEKFFTDSMAIFSNLLKEKNIPSVSTEKALKIIKEVYLFSIQRKEKKPDKQFAEWIVNQYF